jgi:Cu(I)/Ag(I) efflux system membrane fusion protein
MNWAMSNMSLPHPIIRKTLHQLNLWMLVFLWAACNGSTENPHEGHSMDEHAAHRVPALDTSLADIVRSVNQTVISSQQTVKPVIKNTASEIELNGYITEDPRRNQVVATRVGGRVEKLYVKYNYQYIRQGEKLLDVYSPELRTSQEQYLYLIKNSQDKNLIRSAKQKLLLLGLSKNQIAHLERTGKPALTLSVYSPFSGYIILGNTSPAMSANNADNAEGAAQGMNMNEGSSASAVNSSTFSQTNASLREGAYMNVGQTLFTINDFRKVWALLAVNTQDQSSVEVNTQVNIVSELFPEKSITGKINLIEPVFREGIQFMQARVYLDNPGEILKANSLVKAEIKASDQLMMLVPNSSISDLGNRKIVWVKTKDTPSGKKVFEPRTVVTGIRSGDFTQITMGLEKNEFIATQAGFLLDSESMIE